MFSLAAVLNFVFFPIVIIIISSHTCTRTNHAHSCSSSSQLNCLCMFFFLILFLPFSISPYTLNALLYFSSVPFQRSSNRYYFVCVFFKLFILHGFELIKRLSLQYNPTSNTMRAYSLFSAQLLIAHRKALFIPLAASSIQSNLTYAFTAYGIQCLVPTAVDLN